MNKLLVVILLVCTVAFSGCKQQITEVFSPDENIGISFSRDSDGKLLYEVKVKDSLFVSSSLMGFIEKKGVSLSDAFEIVDVLQMKPGLSLGVRTKPYVTGIMRWLYIFQTVKM